MASRAKTLYRSLLRAHQKYLPSEMRSLGDAYVKSEFRLHKTAKPEQAEQFFTEWQKYLDQILMTARAKESVAAGALSDREAHDSGSVFHFGADLPHDVDLTEDQLEQLRKLKEEASSVKKPRPM